MTELVYLKKLYLMCKRTIDLQCNSVEKIIFLRSRSVTTQSLVSKVIKQIDVEEPLIQRSIGKSCHVSQSTISRIIKRLNLVLRKKTNSP